MHPTLNFVTPFSNKPALFLFSFLPSTYDQQYRFFTTENSEEHVPVLTSSTRHSKVEINFREHVERAAVNRAQRAEWTPSTESQIYRKKKNPRGISFQMSTWQCEDEHSGSSKLIRIVIDRTLMNAVFASLGCSNEPRRNFLRLDKASVTTAIAIPSGSKVPDEIELIASPNFPADAIKILFRVWSAQLAKREVAADHSTTSVF